MVKIFDSCASDSQLTGSVSCHHPGVEGKQGRGGVPQNYALGSDEVPVIKRQTEGNRVLVVCPR